MKKMNKKGFTIVELVIVISVIAILSAVLVPTFSNVVKNSKDSADLQSARNAYTEYTMACTEADKEAELNLIYKGENGRYVAIVNGQMGKDSVYTDEAEAKAALGLSLVEDDATTTDTNEQNYSVVVEGDFKIYKLK